MCVCVRVFLYTYIFQFNGTNNRKTTRKKIIFKQKFRFSFFVYSLWIHFAIASFSVCLLVVVCLLVCACVRASICVKKEYQKAHCHAKKYKMKANSRKYIEISTKSNTRIFSYCESGKAFKHWISPHKHRHFCAEQEREGRRELYAVTMMTDDVFVKEIIANKVDVQSLYLPKINKQNERIFHISLVSIHNKHTHPHIGTIVYNTAEPNTQFHDFSVKILENRNIFFLVLLSEALCKHAYTLYIFI